jgi:tetraacyldisaccharide 4'-kinase
VVISDDGLQHYAMGRAIEMVVIDGLRGVGNGLCLPAWPLRETLHRLKHVDFVLVNEGLPAHMPFLKDKDPTHFSMQLIPGKMTSLRMGQEKKINALKTPVAAVAAIGNPQRFFATLTALGVLFNKFPFADHYPFKPEDLSCFKQDIVMTEKDAVKCIPFATDNMYFLPIEAKMDDTFWDVFWSHKQLQGFSCNEG